MKAALPSALKMESETKVRRNKAFLSSSPLPARLQAVMDVLPPRKAMNIEQIAHALGQSSALAAVNRLLEMDAIVVEETITDRTIVKKSSMNTVEEGTEETVLAHPLNDWQTQAYEQIRQQWQTTPVVLLHGVTSSGKTEVYIHLIEEQVRLGKTVLYLVPEIALTTQLTDRLRRVFGARLGVYHSKFSDRARVDVYKKVLEGGHYDVVIGVRSSLFLPFQNLGCIIMDEEHESSYKQQDPAPRYHARSVAMKLMALHEGKLLLGTATPSVETYYQALQGRYGLVEMKQRYAGLSLPHIHVVDLQQQYHKKMMEGHFSVPLIHHIRQQLDAGKQVMLFQNRRGYSPYIECHECGAVPKCVHCDVSLTEHKYMRRLVCHYCGYSIPTPVVCPSCGKGKLSDRGFGTEMIEEEVQRLFPDARVARMDLDTTRSRNAYDDIIGRFARHEVDILIGTQMITKGLHFDDVSLVAVLKTDGLFQQPDFRAAERAYQMLEQVAGRAGRSGEEGHVILQTMDVKNEVLAFLQRHDYAAMYDQQVIERNLFHYPPFHRVISLSVRHREQSRLDTAVRTLQERLFAVFGGRCSAVVIPSIQRVQNQYVRQLTLKIESSANYATAKQMLREQLLYVQSLPSCKGVNIVVDVDPM